MNQISQPDFVTSRETARRKNKAARGRKSRQAAAVPRFD
jgi:hypothetical protein